MQTERSTEKTFLVKLKQPPGAVQRVCANRYEIHGDQLVFLDGAGGLRAMFVIPIVESWSEL